MNKKHSLGTFSFSLRYVQNLQSNIVTKTKKFPNCSCGAQVESFEEEKSEVKNFVTLSLLWRKLLLYFTLTDAVFSVSFTLQYREHSVPTKDNFWAIHF